MLTVVAILPILLLLIIMAILEKPAYIAAPITLVVTLIVATVFWKVDISWIFASLAKGSLVALEIILIIIGAFLLIMVLRKGGAFSHLKHGISSISRDVRVQAIFLAWFLVAFIEGVAGFGTPSMIAAPLMVLMGFSPLAAVATTLIGDGVAVTFGAVGVPVVIGIGQGVSPEQAAALGPTFLRETYLATSVIHAAIGLFVPILILFVLCFIYRKPISKALDAMGLALLAGALFVLPSLVIAYLFGPEFPSVLGSLIGGALFIVAVKYKLWLPKDPWHFVDEDGSYDLRKRDKLDYAKALTPYAVIIALLVASRTDLFGFGDLLKRASFVAHGLFGTDLGYVFSPFYSPGFFFIIAAIIGFAIYRLPRRHIAEVVDEVSLKVVKTFIALVCLLGIVEIMVNSGHNISGFPSFTMQIVRMFTGTGEYWPVFAPFVGLFGAFISGSSTVSNLMFSSIQVDVAYILSIPAILGLALQSIGSAAGNMIAVHNVIAASSVVHLPHAEGKVIKYNILPAIGYALAAGIIGLFAASFL